MEFVINISDEALAEALAVSVTNVEDAFAYLDADELEEVLSDRAVSYAESHRDEVEREDLEDDDLEEEEDEDY